jgi:hypothetical protein
VFVIRATRSRWRWLWIAHPLLTFTVVVVTANHYWLDGLVAISLALPLLLIFDVRRVRIPADARDLDQRLLEVASSSSARTR